MIDYSKVVRKNPINPNAPKKTYAVAQSRKTVSLSELAEHMTEHGCSFSQGTINAVVTDVIKHIKELLLAGNSVSLGDFGKFYVALCSKGVCESVEDRQTGLKPVFTAQNITDVKVNWRPSIDMQNLRQKAEFQCVGTRLEQALEAKEKNEAIADGTYVSPGSKDKDGITEVD